MFAFRVVCGNGFCRCTKEWKLAVQLSRHKIYIAVAVVMMCSRPAPLRPFLYLDFVDRERKKKAWEILVHHISKHVCNVIVYVVVWRTGLHSKFSKQANLY